MDEFEFLSMFRWFKRLVTLAFVVGALFLPQVTTGFVMHLVDIKARQITDQVMHVLRPALSQRHTR